MYNQPWTGPEGCFSRAQGDEPPARTRTAFLPDVEPQSPEGGNMLAFAGNPGGPLLQGFYLPFMEPPITACQGLYSGLTLGVHLGHQETQVLRSQD